MQPPETLWKKWAIELKASVWESNALFVAIFSIDERMLLFGNQAAGHLLGGIPWEGLINPSFEKLAVQKGENPVFEGLLTIGDNVSVNTTTEARVFIKGNEMLIIGEVNLRKILDQNTKMARLNQEVSNLQRKLMKEKFLVENTLEKLQKVNEELEILNREKNRFLSIAAHDLRNPISTAISYTDILLNNADMFPADKQQQFLKTIEERLNFSLKLMAELLDVSRIEAGTIPLQKERTNYRMLLEQAIAFNQLVGKWKEISVNLAFTARDFVFDFDKNKIEQVLNNLISNAIKYSEKGSGVQVTVAQKEGFIHTTIADQGVGIPGHELDGIFEPFKKSSARPTGGESSTGLGLVIAKKIIEEHGGRIGVESTPGVGSSFYFSLPLMPKQ
ncbi:MAG: HAMP domain-containing sensor histidine kinase [Bacteroidales bacterium]